MLYLHLHLVDPRGLTTASQQGVEKCYHVHIPTFSLHQKILSEQKDPSGNLSTQGDGKMP